MGQQDKDLQREEQQQQQQKPAWQQTKESWYDNLNITVKQLDIIIGLGIAGLIIVGIIIAMDSAGVF